MEKFSAIPAHVSRVVQSDSEEGVLGVGRRVVPLTVVRRPTMQVSQSPFLTSDTGALLPLTHPPNEHSSTAWWTRSS